MTYVYFNDEDKIKFFDEIASHFYEANFGQFSKSDFELLMFRFYMEKMILDNKNSDGTINYNLCSDYKISKDLGITQQRVRNLKVKNQLIYPINYDWKIAFAKLIENARYDQENKKVTINIPDPNLFLEIQNFIEENGGYIEKQLNSKVLQLRVEYFIDIILAVESEDNRKKIMKILRKNMVSKNKNEVLNECSVGKDLIKMAVNVSEVAVNISENISAVSTIGKACIKFMSKIW